MSPHQELTISDIARIAGVSVSTVSRVLNNKSDVSASTRDHIKQVIIDLGYSPDAHAQRLAGRKVHRIGMVYPDVFQKHSVLNPIDLEFVVAASTSAGQKGLVLSLITQEITEAELLHLYRSAQVDGVILMQIDVHDWRVEALRKHRYPFVMIGRLEGDDALNFVELEFEQATRLAFDYLYGLGHRQIGFLGLEKHLEEGGFGPAVRSWRAYREVIQQYGIVSQSQEMRLSGQATYDATLRLLDEMPNLTAIVSAHSNNVHLIIQALQARQRHVPHDCSVIAITSSNIAESCVPALTTIHIPVYEMGVKAVQMLARQLEDPDAKSEYHLLNPEVITRGSTAPPNSR